MPMNATMARTIDQPGMSFSSSLTEKDEMESLRDTSNLVLLMEHLYKANYETAKLLSIENSLDAVVGLDL